MADEYSAEFPRRLGRFSLPLYLVYEFPERALAALDGCLVVRCEMLWEGPRLSYMALSKDFDAVPEGEIAPEYTAVIEMLDDGTVRRTWQRTP